MPASFVHQLPLQHRARPDAGIPGDGAVTPARLRHQQGPVGPVDGFFDGDIRIEQREPERSGGVDRQAIRADDKRLLAKPLADALDQVLPVQQVDPRQGDQELIATVAEDLVVGPQVASDVLHRAGEDLVAHGWPCVSLISLR